MKLHYFQISQLPEILFVVIWIVIIPIATLILFKNVKAGAYSSVLHCSKIEQKPVLKTNKNLSIKLKDLNLFTNIVLASVFLSIVFLPWHESIEIIQIPLQLIGIFAVLAIASFYYANDKNSLQRKMRISLIAFLATFYVTMSYTFIYLIQYLHLFLSLPLILCVVTSSAIFGVFFFFVENHLISIRTSIVRSSKSKSFLEMFSKYFMRNVAIMLLLILLFSDSLLLYTIFIEENIGMMILWTMPFILFIARFYRDALRENLHFKNEMGLIDRNVLEDEFNSIVGSKT